MNLVNKIVDLNQLDANDVLWDNLIELTQKGWTARPIFESVRRGERKNQDFLANIIYDNDRPIAWGIRIMYSSHYAPELWLYTHPDYRCKGIQKNMVIPYWDSMNEKYKVCQVFHSQKKVFSYLKNRL